MPGTILNAETAALDGNEAAARVAYKASSVIAIYPITPSSAMAESCDAWAAEGRRNLWGEVPCVVEMQSEAGAAGAAHGALTTGSLTTTFTASQGLLLMIPNMYKIAGELTPAVFHVAARSVATSALSIFGDHSDVMAARQTGWAMLCSGSPQEAQDLAAAAHAATLKTRVPFLHFFDGFRTSHEIQRVRLLRDEDLSLLLDPEALRAHAERALDPERPSLRGTAMNPDTFFQAREASNPFYERLPAELERTLARLAELTGRRYGLAEYRGHPEAERVLVLMGSAAGAAEEAVEALRARGEKVGLLVLRLYRPFPSEAFCAALPRSVRALAVLDRTKEPGAPGEPLFLDALAALEEHFAGGAPRFPARPRVVSGRYGLSSKEFTPGHAAAALAELASPSPRRRFTLGVRDDVTRLSLDELPLRPARAEGSYAAIFYGLGSDGTVGANKNTVKIVAERTPLEVQAYFVYDSKKSGSMTVSHLRFSPGPIRSTYLVEEADLTACHQESLLERVDVLERAREGGTFLLNGDRPPEEAFAALPARVREGLSRKRLRFFTVDAAGISRRLGLKGRINTVMQAAFFRLAELVPEAAEEIKRAAAKTYGRKSADLARLNAEAVDAAWEAVREVPVPPPAAAPAPAPAPGLLLPPEAPEYARRILAPALAGRGDLIPVSALPADGTFPVGTARWEKRGIAEEIPAWDERWCVQCNRCAFVCPHSAIRVKAYPAEAAAGAPAAFKSVPWRGRDLPSGTRYTVQVAPEDCTGCGLCVEACPARNKEEARLKAVNMAPMPPLRAAERENFAFFERLPELHLGEEAPAVKASQLRSPLFEFPGACAGCGETPYLKLLTQLFGDRLLVANATGCSSIYGGNLPSTPWRAGPDGRGPAWSNSLFEDAAEFGLGFRLSADQRRARAEALAAAAAPRLGEALAKALTEPAAPGDAGAAARRRAVAELRRLAGERADPALADLLAQADALVPKSVWVVGGDGWAYDIGYGGLDHVLASGRKVNILVLDTEVYSNTGGQASKATPRAAVAKFAGSGKSTARKDLAAIAMSQGGAFVARTAFGADGAQTVRAFREAEAYPGPSLVIAYSPCIAHGYDLRQGLSQQERAVDCGHWPLLRYDPSRAERGLNPLQLDSEEPSIPLKDYAYRETRYRMLASSAPAEAEALLARAQADIRERWRRLQERAAGKAPEGG